MAVSTRKRNDPRREATRTALIEAAESLVAEVGVEAVSTRQIGAAIGSANTNVVAYHFGSKEALIREVLRYRLPEIDRRRSELMEQADRAGQCSDLRTLVRIFFQPLFEQTDEEGRHSYARFVVGLERSGMIAARGEVQDEFPQTNILTERIRAMLPADQTGLFDVRLRLAFGLVASVLLLIDRESGPDAAKAEADFENAIDMVTAALAAPVNCTQTNN